MSTKGINASNRVPPNAANHSKLSPCYLQLQLPRTLLNRGHYADTRVSQLSRPSRSQAGRLQSCKAFGERGRDGCNVLCGCILDVSIAEGLPAQNRNTTPPIIATIGTTSAERNTLHCMSGSGQALHTRWYM